MYGASIKEDQGDTMTTEQITEIVEMHEYIAATYNHDNPTELMDRLTCLNVYLARTAALLPEAEADLSQKKGEISHRNPDESATRLRYIIESESWREAKIYRQIERLNATIVHQIDAIRTQVSYIKSQARQS
jgi:hypothetical protein